MPRTLEQHVQEALGGQQWLIVGLRHQIDTLHAEMQKLKAALAAAQKDRDVQS